MARFLFFMFLAAFLAAGGVCFFFLEADPSSAVRRDNGSFGDEGYGAFISKDDFTVRSVLSRAASGCVSGDSECVALKAFLYVKDDISLSEGGAEVRSPKNTLAEREGGVADKAVLLASFLENGGIRADIRELGGRPVVYGCGLDPLKLYGKIIEDIRKTPLAARDITLGKGRVWAVSLKTAGGKPLAADIYAKASDVFDMLLFPNETEMKAYLKNKNGRFLEDCSRIGITETEISCLSPSGGMLLFISRAEGNVFSGRVFKGGLLLSDIKSDGPEGAACVPMDPSSAGAAAYPGILP